MSVTENNSRSRYLFNVVSIKGTVTSLETNSYQPYIFALTTILFPWVFAYTNLVSHTCILCSGSFPNNWVPGDVHYNRLLLCGQCCAHPLLPQRALSTQDTTADRTRIWNTYLRGINIEDPS